MTRWMTTIGIAAITAAACAPPRPGEARPTHSLKLCVTNDAVAYGNIIARSGPVRMTVMPGEEICRRGPTTGPYLEVSAVTTGGGQRGPISYANRIAIGPEQCWRWRLTESRASGGDLTPCEWLER